MSILPRGTFDYVVTVPQDAALRQPWPVQLRNPVRPFQPMDPEHEQFRSSVEDRLVGYAPSLTLTDAGVIPHPKNPPARKVWADIDRTRFALTATSRDHATAALVSFHIHTAIAKLLQTGDQIHLARIVNCCMGMSVLREGQLLFAVGTVSLVPLADAVCVDDYAKEETRAAEAAFQKYDPQFHFVETPVRIQLDGLTRILFGGLIEKGPYRVWVEHGAYQLMPPGRSPCLAVWRIPEVLDGPAIASAQLLDGPDALEITNWDNVAAMNLRE